MTAWNEISPESNIKEVLCFKQHAGNKRQCSVWKDHKENSSSIKKVFELPSQCSDVLYLFTLIKH